MRWGGLQAQLLQTVYDPRLPQLLAAARSLDAACSSRPFPLSGSPGSRTSRGGWLRSYFSILMHTTTTAAVVVRPSPPSSVFALRGSRCVCAWPSCRENASARVCAVARWSPDTMNLFRICRPTPPQPGSTATTAAR